MTLNLNLVRMEKGQVSLETVFLDSQNRALKAVLSTLVQICFLLDLIYLSEQNFAHLNTVKSV